MHHVKLEQISIASNRQRREFDEAALDILARSILERGLLHPPTLRNDSDTLVAGERRVRAIESLYQDGHQILCNGTLIPLGFVPVLRLHDLTEIEIEEVELEENTIRVDLSWQELANAQARLHALRHTQAAAEGRTQTLTATASEIIGQPAVGQPITTLRENILLNDYLDDPQVAGAKTRKEALSIVKKRLADVFTERLAQNFDAAQADSPHTLIRGSCLDILPTFEEGYFDIILTDPPYGINAHEMTPLSGSSAGIEHEYVDDYVTASRVWAEILQRGFRITKPNAALYMFCDFRYFTDISEMAGLCGWKVWPTPIIWHKPSGGMLGDVAHGPRKSYETILYAYKGDMRTTGTYLDVIVHSTGDSSLHAANKPVGLYVDLLKRHAIPGMRIIDPCCGSGPIFPAANQLRLAATGIEVSPRHFAVAQSRLAETGVKL